MWIFLFGHRRLAGIFVGFNLCNLRHRFGSGWLASDCATSFANIEDGRGYNSCNHIWQRFSCRFVDMDG